MLESTRTGVKTLLGSAVLSLACAFIFAALTTYGITSISLARVFLFLAGLILVSGSITCDYLCGKTWKHYCAIGFISTIVIFIGAWYLDNWAMRTKVEQEARAMPPPPKAVTKPPVPPAIAFVETPKNPRKSPVQTNTVSGNQNVVGNTVTQGAGGISQIGNGNTVIVPQPNTSTETAKHPAVLVQPGANWESNCDTVYAQPDGTAIENHGEIVSKKLSVNTPSSCSEQEVLSLVIDSLLGQSKDRSINEARWTHFVSGILQDKLGAKVASDFTSQPSLEKKKEFLTNLRNSLSAH